MSPENAVTIALIIGAFSLFAVTLGGVAWWSNRAPRPARRTVPQASREAGELRRVA